MSDLCRLRAGFRFAAAAAAACCWLAIGAASPPAFAQSYPSKPIRLIVPAGAGGQIDTVSRAVARRLSERLGQTIFVENRPGAAGLIGADAAAKAAPDGYTILAGEVGPNAINASVYAKLPYDPVKDFAPITQLASMRQALMVNADVPAKTVAELVQYAKANPGKLNYSAIGTGHISHVTAEMFRLQTGIAITHVPFKGGQEMVGCVASGECQLMFISITTAMPFVQAGKLRPLAVTSPQRLRILPDVPTMEQAGVSGFTSDAWIGFFAPAGTPKEIVDLLYRETKSALSAPDVQEMFARYGGDIVGSTPEEFGQVVITDIPKWAKTVKEAGIRVN